MSTSSADEIQQAAHISGANLSHRHEHSSAYPDKLRMEDLTPHVSASAAAADEGCFSGLFSSWVNPAPPANVTHVHHHQANIGMPDQVPEAALTPPQQADGADLDDLTRLVTSYVSPTIPGARSHES